MLRDVSSVAQDCDKEFRTTTWKTVMAKYPNTNAETVEIKLFHVFVLPALWFFTMLGIWITFRDIGGDDALFLYVSGWVGWWLGYLGMILNSNVLFILLNSIGGILAMALVGFIQDVLRTRKWAILLYPALAVLLAVVNTKGPRFSIEFTRQLLASLCFSIYAISFLVCLIGFVWWCIQKWRHLSVAVLLRDR